MSNRFIAKARRKKSKYDKVASAVSQSLRRFPKPTFKSKVEKILKKDSELKHYTVNGPTSTAIFPSVAYNAVLTDVPMPAAGAQPTDTTRIGDKITITSCHIRWVVNTDADVGNVPDGYTFRIVVYQYKPNNGLLAPNQTRLFASDFTTTPNCLSHQQVDHYRDYHIVYDKVVTLSPNVSAAGTNASNSVRFGSFWVPMKKIQKQLQYDAASLSHNSALYLAVFCNSTGTADPYFNYQSRLRFLDA